MSARHFFMCFLLVAGTFLANAAKPLNLDSINRSLLQLNDTQKVKQLCTIGYAIYESHPATAFTIADKMASIAKHSNYLPGQILSLRLKGTIFAQYASPFESVVALNYFRQGLRLAERNRQLTYSYKIYINIGDIFSNQGMFDSSYYFYNTALKQIESLEKKSAQTTGYFDPQSKLIAYAAIADGYFQQGKTGHALSYYLKRLKVAEDTKQLDDQAISLFQIGCLYHSMKMYEKALDYYTQALELNKQLNNHLEIARCLNNLGNVYQMQHDFAKAADYYLQSLQIKQALHNKNEMANTLMNLGNLNDSASTFDKGISYYKMAFQLYTDMSNANGIANVSLNIGKKYLRRGDYKSALPYMEKGLAAAKILHRKDLCLSCYVDLGDIYSHTGDYQRAYAFQKDYAALKDTLLREENLKSIADAQAKYQTDKKEKEIQLQKSEIGKQQIIRNALLTGVLLLFLIVFLIYYRYRDNKIKTAKIEKQSKEIHESITYAQRIQQALLPNNDDILNEFNESFVLYKPKDIVSGDFYWHEKTPTGFVFAAIDCTGHGVPGAFMSVMAHNALFQLSNEVENQHAGEILDNVHQIIRHSLKQDKQNSESRDGMDMALCKINLEKTQLDYAGANRPLIYIRNGVLTELKPDKKAIGGLQTAVQNKFTSHSLDLQKGDIIYLYTDGYVDQFGGPQGKKFLTKRFKQLLEEIHHFPAQQQRTKLSAAIMEWMKGHEQVDDILVMGIRIG